MKIESKDFPIMINHKAEKYEKMLENKSIWEKIKPNQM